MNHSVISILITSLLFLSFQPVTAQTSDHEPLRVIAFGAHPDDAELSAGGVAALWAAAGHEVKFVSLTNGDIGHFKIAGGPLAIRRMNEVQECAEIFGITTEVLDIHDGELIPTLENRKKVARLIRDWQADIVLAHRPWDYHPDHRYTGVLANDATVLVAAPFFTPDTPPVDRNPVLLYHHDSFQKPYPFEPTLVVGFDEVADKKWDCIRAMPSQFADEHSWQASYNADNMPEDEEERAEFILDRFKQRYARLADQYRDRLIELYGKEKGRSIKYAEAFELSEYGTGASIE
ncbi:MAG: PIG-L family deacetylase, partial [Balneolaceae bacterium]